MGKNKNKVKDMHIFFFS